MKTQTGKGEAPELQIIASSWGGCQLDEAGHCTTCMDEALQAEVVEVDQTQALAQVQVDGELSEVDISLVDGVEVGDRLLIHGGVALERLDAVALSTKVSASWML